MKLLFDQNLSFRLCERLADVFPGSQHVRTVGLSQADDRAIWAYAGAHEFVLVSLDTDFADFPTLFGWPPKVVLIRGGNRSTEVVADLLLRHAEAILAFGQEDAGCLELYWP